MSERFGFAEIQYTFGNVTTFGLIFGWTSIESLEIPYLTMTLDKKRMIPRGTLKAPMMCLIVFVGGRYVEKVDLVQERAEALAESFFIIKPLMYFFEDLNLDISITKSINQPMVFYNIMVLCSNELKYFFRFSSLLKIQIWEYFSIFFVQNGKISMKI